MDSPRTTRKRWLGLDQTRVRLIALLLLVMPGAADARRQGDPVIAIVGATVIDGTGRELQIGLRFVF